MIFFQTDSFLSFFLNRRYMIFRLFPSPLSLSSPLFLLDWNKNQFNRAFKFYWKKIPYLKVDLEYKNFSRCKIIKQSLLNFARLFLSLRYISDIGNIIGMKKSNNFLVLIYGSQADELNNRHCSETYMKIIWMIRIISCKR